MLRNDSSVTENNTGALRTSTSADLMKTKDQESISSIWLDPSQPQHCKRRIIIIERHRSNSLCSFQTVSSESSSASTSTNQER